jgi:DnaJ like chaperone protein
MWGKIFGVLFGLALLKSWLGALVGLAIGHWFDRSFRRSFEDAGGFAALKREQADPQALFMYSTFAVMGHMAKADGVVTPAHIEKASLFMQQLGLDVQQQQEAQRAFREGKSVDFPLQAQLLQLKQAFRWRPDLLQMFLEIQISVAYVDARLSDIELKLLQQVAAALSISATKLQFLLGRFEAEARFARRPKQAETKASTLADAYQLLGLTADCTEHDLKKAYKKQMSQHHPDKLMSQGLPKEMMELAKRKTQDIQAAYELIKQYRSSH